MRENKALRIFLTVIIAVGIAAASFLGGFFVSKLTRDKQSSSFEWALNIIRENYYKDIPDDVLLNASLKGLADECLDRYSTYYTAEEYKSVVEASKGNMSGVGISYMYVPSKESKPSSAHPTGIGGVVIEKVVGNSPAYLSGFESGKKGLRAGEIVTALKDGNGTVQITSSSVFSDFIDGKETGEEFTMITDRGEHVVSKQNYEASYCTMITSTDEWSVVYNNGVRSIVSTGDGYDFLPEKTACLRLDQFYANAAYEMASLIEKFNAEGYTSLILDLRGNGGGFVNVMCDISGIFTGQLEKPYKIAMHAVYKGGGIEGYSVSNRFSGNQLLKKGTKLSVLADNGTASASEALIGVLIDNGVIDYSDIYLSDFSQNYLNLSGTAAKNCKSYGKGIMQTTFVNQSTGEALKLTTARIYWPKGETCIHDVGLTVADGCRTVKTDWDVMYGDPQLKLAVEMICG